MDSPIATLASNHYGWFARDYLGRPVGYSSKDMLAAVNEAEGNGYYVRYFGRIIDTREKEELRRRLAARNP